MGIYSRSGSNVLIRKLVEIIDGNCKILLRHSTIQQHDAEWKTYENTSILDTN